jgi:hypothetical protein
MRGGSKEVAGELWFTGTNPGGARKKKVALASPTILLEADIEEDVLISHEWLGERSFDIHAKKHGLMAHVSDREIWLPGIAEPRPEESERRVPRSVKCIAVCSGLRALHLFCCRKSAAVALQKYGFQVVSLDNDESRQPDICTDILDWEYTVFPPGFFLVTAAPPCTEYSQAMNRRLPRMDLVDAVVHRTLEVIAYLQPQRWWLETPRNGRLARRDFMTGYPVLDCDQ